MARHQSRRGSAYVFVLAASLLLVAIAVGAIMVPQAEYGRARLRIAEIEARNACQSLLELGLERTENLPLWRSQRAGNPQAASATLAGATGFAEVMDPADNDLDDSLDDPVRLYAVGEAGSARKMVQVMLDPEYEPLSCLNYSIRVGRHWLASGTTLRANAAVGAGGNVTAVFSGIYPPVVAAGAINGGIYFGTRTQNSEGTGSATSTSNTTADVNIDGDVTAIHLGQKSALATPMAYTPGETMPVAGKVFDNFAFMGTSIPLASLPGRVLANQLLSPASNPFGVTNASGIYVIDCAGQSVVVRNVRVVGTLVLRNAGSSTRLDEAVNFEPAMPGYPCLLIEGSATFALSRDDLDEGSVNANFNPAGTPYRNRTNTTTTDEYANELRGIVYVSQDLGVTQNLTVMGTLIVGRDMGTGYDIAGLLSATPSASPSIIVRRTGPSTTPPPGFYKLPGFAIRSGSVAQVSE